jgi:hypothetical protein
MKLKVLVGIMARKRERDHDTGFTPLSIGDYPIRTLDDGQFEIVKPDGSLCYVFSVKLEENIQVKAVKVVK